MKFYIHEKCREMKGHVLVGHCGEQDIRLNGSLASSTRAALAILGNLAKLSGFTNPVKHQKWCIL